MLPPALPVLLAVCRYSHGSLRLLQRVLQVFLLLLQRARLLLVVVQLLLQLTPPALAQLETFSQLEVDIVLVSGIKEPLAITTIKLIIRHSKELTK